MPSHRRCSHRARQARGACIRPFAPVHMTLAWQVCGEASVDAFAAGGLRCRDRRDYREFSDRQAAALARGAAPNRNGTIGDLSVDAVRNVPAIGQGGSATSPRHA